MDGCVQVRLFRAHLWMSVSGCDYFKAHLRVGVPILNTFMSGCERLRLFKAHL